MDPALGTALVVSAAVVGRGVHMWDQRRIVRRQLVAGAPDAALCLDHLSPGLARVATHSRFLRRQLETPLRRCAATATSVMPTPWKRRERCDAYDLAVVDARRATWDWLLALDGLEPADRGALRRLGLSPVAVRKAVFGRGLLDRTEDPWEQVVYADPPDAHRVASALQTAMECLHAFEVALMAYRPHQPYR